MAKEHTEEKPDETITNAKTVPVTKQYKVEPTKGAQYILQNPGLPRFNQAADISHPHGTEFMNAFPYNTRTVLQNHVDFFDRDKDGVITAWETFQGFRAIGFNFIFSLFAVFVIHTGFSFVTNDFPWWFPFDPLLRINTNKIHKAKHGSDTGVIDTEGRFVPQKFEELFSKYDKDGKGALNLGELFEMTEHMRNVLDLFGWWAAKFEWFTTYLLCADHNGLVSKEKIRGVYDGSLFYEIEKDLKDAKKKRE